MGTFEQLRQAMRERADEIKPAMVETTRQNARLIQRRSVANLDSMVYARPPDRKAKYAGKKLPKGRKGGKEFRWTQTGTLKRSEKAAIESEDGGLTAVLVNRARAKKGGQGYSHARHNLALKSGDPRIIPPPPSRERESDRIAPFRAQAIIDTEDERLDNYRRGVLDVLRRTKV